MARKKIIFVIVEGPSDDEALGVILNRLYDKHAHIRTAKMAQLIERNKRKSVNINRICFMSKVWGAVPYNAYYMSSNLDHVLYNKLNSTDSDFSVCDNFKQSWEYIKEEKHSLERHTNLGICFKEIRQERKTHE